MNIKHFTAIKHPLFGWHIYHGEPDNRGVIATHAGFTHSDLVFDWVEMYGKEIKTETFLHFDTRGG